MARKLSTARRCTDCAACTTPIYPGMQIVVVRYGRASETEHADCQQARREAASYRREYLARESAAAERQEEQCWEDFQDARLSGATVRDALDYANRVPVTHNYKED